MYERKCQLSKGESLSFRVVFQCELVLLKWMFVVCSAFSNILNVKYNCNICSSPKAIRIMLLGGYELFMDVLQSVMSKRGQLSWHPEDLKIISYKDQETTLRDTRLRVKTWNFKFILFYFVNLNSKGSRIRKYKRGSGNVNIVLLLISNFSNK